MILQSDSQQDKPNQILISSEHNKQIYLKQDTIEPLPTNIGHHYVGTIIQNGYQKDAISICKYILTCDQAHLQSQASFRLINQLKHIENESILKYYDIITKTQSSSQTTLYIVTEPIKKLKALDSCNHTYYQIIRLWRPLYELANILDNLQVPLIHQIQLFINKSKQIIVSNFGVIELVNRLKNNTNKQSNNLQKNKLKDYNYQQLFRICLVGQLARSMITEQHKTEQHKTETNIHKYLQIRSILLQYQSLSYQQVLHKFRQIYKLQSNKISITKNMINKIMALRNILCTNNSMYEADIQILMNDNLIKQQINQWFTKINTNEIDNIDKSMATFQLQLNHINKHLQKLKILQQTIKLMNRLTVLKNYIYKYQTLFYLHYHLHSQYSKLRDFIDQINIYHNLYFYQQYYRTNNSSSISQFIHQGYKIDIQLNTEQLINLKIDTIEQYKPQKSKQNFKQLKFLKRNRFEGNIFDHRSQALRNYKLIKNRPSLKRSDDKLENLKESNPALMIIKNIMEKDAQSLGQLVDIKNKVSYQQVIGILNEKCSIAEFMSFWVHSTLSMSIVQQLDNFYCFYDQLVCQRFINFLELIRKLDGKNQYKDPLHFHKLFSQGILKNIKVNHDIQ